MKCGFYCEVSNLTGEGVNETMEKFLSLIIAKFEVDSDLSQDTLPLLTNTPTKSC